MNDRIRTITVNRIYPPEFGKKSGTIYCKEKELPPFKCKADLIEKFQEGEKYKIEFSISEYKGKQYYWIEQAKPAEHEVVEVARQAVSNNNRSALIETQAIFKALCELCEEVPVDSVNTVARGLMKDAVELQKMMNVLLDDSDEPEPPASPLEQPSSGLGSKLDDQIDF